MNRYVYPIKVNQNGDCFSLITLDGVKIYQIEPIQLRFQRNFGKALFLAEVLQRSNILVLVYTTEPCALYFWDDKQETIIKRLNFDPDGAIINVRFHDQYLLVILNQVIVIYEIENFNLVNRINTFLNPHGLGVLNQSLCLFCPARDIQGQIQIVVPDKHESIVFQAHENSLSALAISPNSKLLASASKKGTIIRIWSLENLAKPVVLAEFRRGLEATKIHALVFHPNSNLLCVTGETETAHIYCLESLDTQQNVEIKPKRPKSLLAKAWQHLSQDLPQYLTSNTSLIQINVPVNSTPIFSTNGELIYFLTPKGQIYKYAYNLDLIQTQQILFQQLT